MYKSPIELYFNQMQMQMDEQLGEQVYKAVTQVGINIDKDELFKALANERDQYNEGFYDGVKEARERVMRLVLELQDNLDELARNAYRSGIT